MRARWYSMSATGCAAGGSVIVDADGEWFDLRRTATLGNMPPPPHPHLSVRLDGVDLAAVPTEFGPNNSIPGHVTITGIWLGDGIRVESMSPAGLPRSIDAQHTTPPCPPPAGGWPHGAAHENLNFDRDALQRCGAAVTVGMWRPSDDQVVLVVTASDVVAVKTLLGPQLPGRLCVVPSRWTRAQLDEVSAQLRDFALEELRCDRMGQRVDDQAQVSIEVQLMRVTEEIAAWANTVPRGLLELTPSLVPG
jgi:hypothetical protein